MITYIYSLNSGDKVLYVGRTINPLSRFQSHISKVPYRKKSGNLYRDIYNCLKENRVFTMHILCECDQDKASYWEEWHTHNLSKSHKLHNLSYLTHTFDNYSKFDVIKSNNNYQVDIILKNRFFLVYNEKIEMVSFKDLIKKNVLYLEK
jgi:predicted GIY-YIG superfamily endonuclease